ncbi:MAG TPA: hypothetical protein VMR33_19835 [Candidatus Baltobacteraceae bacterium]|jgi:hypothetical protein|nr:hypothetical protein [Candidatus Baltobacteraceae bacterium]
MRNAFEDENEAFETSRPFSSPCFAAAVLDCSKYSLSDYIQSGVIPLAFDIGMPGATRLCLRVSTASVLAVRTGLKASSDMAKFFDGAFPKDRPHYRPPRLAWMLHCDYDHIYHLLAGNVLADAGGATRYQIPRQSILDFLAGRRLA